MASYDQLVNKGGTIYNTAANVAYANPDQLAMDLGVTAKQIDWGKIASNPGYTPPSSKAITVDQLQTVKPVQVPTAQPNPAPSDSAIAGAGQTTKSTQDYISQFTAPDSAEQKQAAGLSQSIQELLGQTAGQTKALGEEEAKLGVPETGKEIAALNADLLRQVQEYNVAKADYDKQIALAEDKTQSLGKIRGEQGRIARAQIQELNMKASEAKLTEARISGKIGQMEQAQDAAKRAVDLRYAGVTEELEIKAKQLSVLQASGILDKQERIQAMALEAKYNDEQATIAEAKAKAKSNLDLALTLGISTQFANRNGEFFNVRTGKTYGTAEEFFKDAGVKSFEEAFNKGLVSNIDNASIQEKAQVGRLMADYFDAGITMADGYQSALNKVKRNSGKYRKETYIAPQPRADDPWAVKPSPTDIRVRQIIAANPAGVQGVGWGTAADQIDAEFGKGTSTKYDSWLKQVYQNGQSVNTLKPMGGSGTGATPQRLAYDKSNIEQLDSLLSGDKYFNNAVGRNYAARLTLKGQGSKSNFIAGVEELRSQLTLEALQNAKANGATFGALSEGELKLLSASASKLGTWAIVKDGKVTGYETDPTHFRKELEKISNFAKLDYVLKGGSPEDVGMKIMPDGSIFVKNSTGDYTQFNELN